VEELYAHPDLLWVGLPVILYWLSRVWLLANRGEVHDDPVVFALRDRVSYLVLALLVAMVMVAA
jgi:4-hydroxybenzoate polyprenyltransferase